MAEKPTYRELIGSDRFVASAYRSLKALGETPTLNRKEIVDKFLREKRFFDNNLYSVFSTASDVESMSDRDRASFGYALSTAESMPHFYQDGGAPVWPAIWDHVGALITDPSNLGGALAGTATFGVAGGAALGARQAAKQTTTQYIKNKLKAVVSRPTIYKELDTPFSGVATSFGTFSGSKVAVGRTKLPPVATALAVESGVAGAGGFVSDLYRQSTEKKVGVRDKIDLSDAALRGIAEGPLSVFAGGVFAGTVGSIVKSLDNTVGDSAAASWLGRTFLPKSYRKEVEVRIMERLRGLEKSFAIRSENIKYGLDRAITKAVESGEFKDKFGRTIRDEQEAIDLVNKALTDGQLLETRFGSWDESFKLPKDVAALTREGQNLIRELQRYAESTPNISQEFRSLYSATENYARDAFEVFSVSVRAKPFNQFINEKPHVIDDMISYIQGKGGLSWVKRQFEDLRINKMYGSSITPQEFIKKLEGPDAKKWAKALANRLYEPKKGGFKLGASSEAKKIIPEFQREIWGQNPDPGQRILWSVAGVMDHVNKIRFGAELGESLVTRGQAVRASTREEAAELLNVREGNAVRIIGDAEDSLINVPKERIESSGKDIWITQDRAKFLSPVVRPMQGGFLGKLGEFVSKQTPDQPWVRTIFETPARIQGTLKLGKTIYNPVAHVRNALGAGQAFIGSGAGYRTVEEVIRFTDRWRTMSKVERAAEIDKLQKLGITSTSVELEQMLTRLGRDVTEDPGFVEKVGTLGLAGTKVGRTAMKVYQGTDNISKILSYMAELNAERALWKTLDPHQKTQKIRAMRSEMGEVYFSSMYKQIPGGKPQWRWGTGWTTPQAKMVLDEEQIISELAARKTLNIMPVYTRVPTALEYMAGVPVVGNFSAYPAEVFRNGWNIMDLGARELEEGLTIGSKALASKGVQRMLSLYGMAATPFIIAQGLNQIRGDEQAVESLRKFVAPWDRYGALTIDKINPKTLEVEYTKWDYSNPYQPITSVIAPVITGIMAGDDANETLKTHGLAAAEAMVSPFTDDTLVLQSGQALWNLSTQLLRTKKNQQLVDKSLRDLYRNSAPAYVQDTVDVTKAVGGLPLAIERVLFPRFAGERKPPVKDLGQLRKILHDEGYNIGAFKAHKVNLKTATSFAMDRLGDVWKPQWTNNLKKMEDTLREKLENTRRDPAEHLARYEDTLQSQFAAQQGIAKLYIDTKNLIGRARARKIFFSKDLQGVTPSKLALSRLLDDKKPHTHISRLSANKDFWRKINRSNPDLNTGAWHAALREIEDRYNAKDPFTDPAGYTD